jgi:PEP-CTERM motif
VKPLSVFKPSALTAIAQSSPTTKFVATLGGCAVALAAANSASAATITLDSFSVAQGTVVTSTSVAPQSTTVGNRTITVTSTTPNPLNNPFVNVAVVSGPNANYFSISNPSLTSSTVELSYVLGANAALASTAPATLEFDVISRDLSSFVAISFAGAAGSFSIANAAIPAAPPASVFYAALTPAYLGALAGGGTFKLTFSGIPDYDLTIDNLRINVPLPGTLALLGLGLLAFVGRKQFSRH